MKLQKLIIDHFRSIENVEIDFPEKNPVVLFGPNNAGKSNILKALDCILGEKYASYIEFDDSDFFNRERESYPNISIKVKFDEVVHSNRGNSTKKICFTTNYDSGGVVENTYHFEDGAKMYLKNDEREKCQFVMIDATRDMSRQLSYFSQYSILSKMSKKMHKALVKTSKDELDKHFKKIKEVFENVPEYQQFFKRLQDSFAQNMDGFEHKLEVDLSAYDPNNYFNSLRIIARDSGGIRSYSEFGTGEQQILLMSFMMAYAETFKGENFILGVEEPEAHLHPLAQKWLAKNLETLSKSGVQVVITTHSPEFLNIENLEGFVRVYKEEGITKIIQHNAKSLAEKCVSLGANPDKTKEETILNFYKTNTFYDQLKGFFARKILLVEGSSELFSLPNYFTHFGYELIKEGVEIIDCRGKSQIARNYRLFTAYGYTCFCLFDADASDGEKKRANQELGQIFEFDPEYMVTDKDKFTTIEEKAFGYFGKDYENYLRGNLDGYIEKENIIEGTKVLKAKVLSEENSDYLPIFIEDIAKFFNLNNGVPDVPVEPLPEYAPVSDVAFGPQSLTVEVPNPDDIPF